MGQELEGDCLGDEYKGYIFKISGGNDKDGFPMRQGVMVKVWKIFKNINFKGRVRLLLDKD